MNVELGKGPVEQYLAGVRAALADLPGPEVAEIVDDVRGHLADVRAEVGPDADLTTLNARLGTPEAYAAELRSAAGYPEPPPATPSTGSGAARLALVGLVVATGLASLAGLWLFGSIGGRGVFLLAILAALLGVPALLAGGPRMGPVAALPVVRRLAGARPVPASPGGRVAAFVASLQPAWWLLRALVAAMIVGLFLGRGGSFEGTTAALTLIFGAISVWLGFRSRADRRLLWLVVPLNAFAAVLVLTGWPGWASAAGYVGYTDSAVAYPSPYYPGLWQDGERPILDIRPVDALGTPLTGVYLFDQDGRPIDTGDECAGYTGDMDYGRATPVAPYPRGSARYDESTGECTLVPPGPLVVAVPSAVPSTTGPPPGSTSSPVPAPTDVTDPPPPPTVPASPTG